MSLLEARKTYKPFEYPWAYEFWKRQQQLHWLPEEVPLGEDCRDWAQKISEHERNLLTQIFRFFTQADVDKWDLMMLHFQAWEKGIKSLYYLRSKSVQRAGFAGSGMDGGVEADNTLDAKKVELMTAQTDYDECLACQ